MGFRVNLYAFSKRYNSTLRPSGNGFVTTCEAHDPVNIMAPMMKFNLSSVIDYNYMYVQDWDRYYWIDSWTYDKGIWLATCSIDPLASWRNSIGNMTEYVLRSADEWTPDVVDTTYPLTATVNTDRINMAGWDIPNNPSGCHVVGIVGLNGLVRYYLIDNLPEFGSYMFTSNENPALPQKLWLNIIKDDPGVQAGGYPSFMKAQFNPLQYVVSLTWYPFEVPHTLNKYPVYFGYFDSGYTAYLISTASYMLCSGTIRVPPHPQSDRGIYLNLAPYTRLRVSAFPWGEVDLDTTKFANKDTIRFQAFLDPVTGSTKLYIANGDGDVIITLIGQIGVTEQLSQVLKDNLATVTGGLSALAGAASALTGNVMGGLATVASGIGNAISAQYPDVSTTGTNGARIAVAPSHISLIVTHQMIVEEDRPNHGRPLCERRQLSSLPGYLVISDPDVSIPATKDEIEAIRQFMVSGFFYE